MLAMTDARNNDASGRSSTDRGERSCPQKRPQAVLRLVREMLSRAAGAGTDRAPRWSPEPRRPPSRRRLNRVGLPNRGYERMAQVPRNATTRSRAAARPASASSKVGCLACGTGEQAVGAIRQGTTSRERLRHRVDLVRRSARRFFRRQASSGAARDRRATWSPSRLFRLGSGAGPLPVSRRTGCPVGPCGVIARGSGVRGGKEIRGLAARRRPVETGHRDVRVSAAEGRGDGRHSPFRG